MGVIFDDVVEPLVFMKDAGRFAVPVLHQLKVPQVQERLKPLWAFRFSREGKVNVFYWAVGQFGYAISADVDRAALARVSGEVGLHLNGVPR